jgi:hypothetical protein
VSDQITALVRHLVIYSGREPDGFTGDVLEDGSIGITGPHCAVFYPPVAWVSKFVRHLHRGMFDLQDEAAGGAEAAGLQRHA